MVPPLQISSQGEGGGKVDAPGQRFVGVISRGVIAAAGEVFPLESLLVGAPATKSEETAIYRHRVRQSMGKATCPLLMCKASVAPMYQHVTAKRSKMSNIGSVQKGANTL